MLGSHFSEANYEPKNNLEKEPPAIQPINRGGRSQRAAEVEPIAVNIKLAWA
jgi:hypothetical protein